MDEGDLVDTLCEGIMVLQGRSFMFDDIKSCNGFKDEGVLTNNTGFVIRTKNNEVFHVTVQKH